MKNVIQDVYLLYGEEPGDVTMEAKGVVIVMTGGQFRVFCIQSNHNRFRTMINRHAWTALEQGVRIQESEFRLDKKTSEVQEKGWIQAASIPFILNYLRTQHERNLFFLERQIAALS